MIKACDALAKTSLFSGLDRVTFHHYCSVTKVRSFARGEIVSAEGDICGSIGVIEQGQIAMQKYTSSGDFATIGLLGPGDFFGEDLIFGSSNIYTFTLEAMTQSEVLFVSKETLRALLDKSPVILNNFLRILSDRVTVQNSRIALLSQKSLRHKIAFYLLELKTEQHPGSVGSVTVSLPVSKEVIAKLLAMPRPSFSRELIAMENDGLLEVKGRTIRLVDVSTLENDVVEGFQFGRQ